MQTLSVTRHTPGLAPPTSARPAARNVRVSAPMGEEATSTRRATLLGGLTALLATAALPAFPAAAAVAAPPRLPKLDAKKLYGSEEKAEAARAAAVEALKAGITPDGAGAVLRFAFHDAGTWDAEKGTGGANGSLRLELDRPENGGGLKYALAILTTARDAAKKNNPKTPQLSWADFIQVAGAVAVSSTGGPEIPVPLGRPDARKPDPGGQLPPLTLDAAGLRTLFSRNGYSDEQIVALSGAHTLGLSRANPPKGAALSPTPNAFNVDYFTALQKGKGVFPSDRALMTDPVFKKFVSTFAKDKKAFFKSFSEAYVAMGLKGLAVA